MSNVVIYAGGIRGGGAETYLRGLLPKLTALMPDDHFIFFIAESRLSYYQSLGQNVTINKVSDKILDSKLTRIKYEFVYAYEEVKAYNPDLCLFASEIFSPMFKRLNCPIVIVYHATLQFYMKGGVDESALRLVYTRLMRRVSANNCDRIVAVSHFERAEIGGRYPKHRMDKIAVVYHGLDHTIFRPANDFDKSVSPFDYPYLLCVSDRHKHKRMLEMLQVYCDCVKKHSIQERLVIIGRVKSNAVNNEIQQYIKDNNLSNHITILDYIDNGKIRDYYCHAKIYWTNSNHESFGLTPLEAMACGLPVFCPWRESFPEVYRDAAKYYNTYTMTNNEIAEKMYGFISSVNELEQYRLKGLKLAEDFTWDKAADEYKKIIEIEMRKFVNRE